MMKLILLVALFFLGLIITIQAYKKGKENQFYTDTKILNFFSIYVWGDALVIGPFISLSAVFFVFLTPIWMLRYILLFYALRSLIEIIYWITHQVARRDYMPALLRRVSWLKPNDVAILYQVAHTCFATILLFSFLLTFHY